MSDIMEFANREEFRSWLNDNCLTSEGVWLLFGKAGGSKTIKAAEAISELNELQMGYKTSVKDTYERLTGILANKSGTDQF